MAYVLLITADIFRCISVGGGSDAPEHRRERPAAVKWPNLIVTMLPTLPMLHYALVFFVIALIAAAFGFTGIGAGAASLAKILFFLFLIFALVALLGGCFKR